MTDNDTNPTKTTTMPRVISNMATFAEVPAALVPVIEEMLRAETAQRRAHVKHMEMEQQRLAIADEGLQHERHVFIQDVERRAAYLREDLALRKDMLALMRIATAASERQSVLLERIAVALERVELEEEDR